MCSAVLCSALLRQATTKEAVTNAAVVIRDPGPGTLWDRTARTAPPTHRPTDRIGSLFFSMRRRFVGKPYYFLPISYIIGVVGVCSSSLLLIIL